MEKKSGFISLIGRPSSGKSTLINTICGYKISIVSNSPQTTQFTVRGIYNDDESQMIFIDTPGFHHFDSNLNRGLSNLAVRTLNEGDLVLYLVDSSRDFGEEEEKIIGKLKLIDKKIITAFNKIDLNSAYKEIIKKKIKESLKNADFIEISAKTESNINELIDLVKKLLPFGPLYYPEEYVTDQSIPFRIKEVVREKAFLNTAEEIPHSIYVVVNSLDVNEEKIITYATIFVEKMSQKGMIIGKGGRMIKKIGEEARHDLEEIFERKVNLFLNVKLHLNWRKDEKFLKKMFNLDQY